LLGLWHALPMSEYSVENRSGWPAALRGWLEGRKNSLLVANGARAALALGAGYGAAPLRPGISGRGQFLGS